MAKDRNTRENPRDPGGSSPAKGEAKRQAMSGHRGGSQEARPEGGVTKQPAQTSGRRSARHEHVPSEHKSFEPENDPSRQGDGDPSPRQITEHQRANVPEGRSGSHRAQGERTTELSVQGGPDAEHARHDGRHHVPSQPKRPLPEGEAEQPRGGQE